MNEIIALRINEQFLKKIDELSETEDADRSTTLRSLLARGYQERLREKAIQEYLNRKITLSQAAYQANVTLWEMQQLLIQKGFQSQYSINDLEEEMNILRKK